MHSVANLATLQTPLVNLVTKKSAQTLFSLRELPVLPREREVLLSQHAHTPLSFSLSLSPHLLSFYSARAHTSFSLSLRLFSLYSARAHTSLSFSLSLSPRICSVSISARAYTSLSLSALLSFCSAHGREEQSLIQLNTDIVACFSNFTCKYSQNHSTAIVIIIWVFYLIRHRLDYKDFLCRLTSCKGELVM